MVKVRILKNNLFSLFVQLEIDDASELTEEFLYDELHPKKNIATMKFEKPKGPARKGPRKLIKTTD
jgi:twinfilin-like protein